MADTQYKIVGTKYYVYPDTELEASFVAGEADFPSGYELYMNVTSYYKVLEKYTDNLDHIHQYDYYLHCVRVPEWASGDTPEPTYKAIIINDDYGLSYVLTYFNGTPISDPTHVEVGKKIIFSTNDTGYDPIFPEGLDVEEYGTVAETGATAYLFTMPDYDVEISTTPHAQNYTITVVNQDEVQFDLYDNDWNAITGPIPEGTYVNALLKNRAYKVTSNDIYLIDQDWNTQYNQYHYTFIMPNSDITLTVSARAVNDINISNPDSITTELYTTQWETITGQDVYEGQVIKFYVDDLGYQATFTGVDAVEELVDSKYKYTFRMPDADVDIVVEQRQTSNLSVNLTDTYSINPTIFKNREGWSISDWHDLLEGDLVSIQWQTQGYALTSNDVSINTFWEGSESTWKAQFTMPSTDVDVTMDVGVLPAPISFSQSSSTAYLQDTNVYPSLVNDESLTVSYGSSDTGVATIDPSTGEITLVDEGTTTISASFAGDSTFSSTTVTFTLTVVSGLRPRHVVPIRNNTTTNDTFYDITTGTPIYDRYSYTVTAGDQMALIDGNNVGSSYNAKVMVKDGSNNWTTLTTTQDTIVYNDETMYCVKFTIPATVEDDDYYLFIGASEDIYDVSINVAGAIYNEGADWWYTEEDQNNPGTYITKYPENCNLGLESRQGQTYTINPPQTQEQGGSVGMYIVMPATDIEITRTNI